MWKHRPFRINQKQAVDLNEAVRRAVAASEGIPQRQKLTLSVRDTSSSC